LGCNFFAESNIDFRHGLAEMVLRANFSAPADAFDLAATFDEGIPPARASIRPPHGDRFAPDTGSQALVIPRWLWEHRSLDLRALDAREFAGQRHDIDRYLEGAIVTFVASVPRSGTRECPASPT